jgi:hypothetical protein
MNRKSNLTKLVIALGVMASCLMEVAAIEVGSPCYERIDWQHEAALIGGTGTAGKACSGTTQRCAVCVKATCRLNAGLECVINNAGSSGCDNTNFIKVCQSATIYDTCTDGGSGVGTVCGDGWSPNQDCPLDPPTCSSPACVQRSGNCDNCTK